MGRPPHLLHGFLATPLNPIGWSATHQVGGQAGKQGEATVADASALSSGAYTSAQDVVASGALRHQECKGSFRVRIKGPTSSLDQLGGEQTASL